MFCISVIEETVFGTSGLLLNRQRLINCFHLGCSVPVAHIVCLSPCIDAQALHGLDCKQVPRKKMSRHQVISDVSGIAVSSACVSVTKKSVGLTRLDVRRPRVNPRARREILDVRC